MRRTVNEAEDVEAIASAVDEVLTLLTGHLELSTADAQSTISSVHTVLSSPGLSQSLERVSLRSLNKTLTQAL